MSAYFKCPVCGEDDFDAIGDFTGAHMAEAARLLAETAPDVPADQDGRVG